MNGTGRQRCGRNRGHGHQIGKTLHAAALCRSARNSRTRAGSAAGSAFPALIVRKRPSHSKPSHASAAAAASAVAKVTFSYSGVAVQSDVAAEGVVQLTAQPGWWPTPPSLGAAGLYATLPAAPSYAGDTLTLNVYRVDDAPMRAFLLRDARCAAYLHQLMDLVSEICSSLQRVVAGATVQQHIKHGMSTELQEQPPAKPNSCGGMA